jgi:hypothetical protein
VSGGTAKLHLMHVGFEVFTAVLMTSFVVADMILSSPLKVKQRFGGINLHLQGQKISQARNQRLPPASG